MGEPRSFVVRVYRQGYRMLAGTVEDTKTADQRAYRSADELLAILRGRVDRRASPVSTKTAGSFINARRKK